MAEALRVNAAQYDQVASALQVSKDTLRLQADVLAAYRHFLRRVAATSVLAADRGELDTAGRLLAAIEDFNARTGEFVTTDS